MILPGPLDTSVQAAAAALRRGDLLGLPTETVYGLAADADNDAAVAAIFAAKGRPSDHPLIVHVAEAEAIDHFAHSVPAWARALAQAFWPGPLTLILPRRADRAAAAAGGQASVGVRCPSHPVAQAVLRACAHPPAGERVVWGLAAPSANRFGRVSPTTAAHVRDELGDTLLVLDGGACDVGIESTIIDCTRSVPVLLRPGAITRAQIEAVCGMAPRSPDEVAEGATPRASGTLESHYAPTARVRLMDAKALQTGLDLLGSDAAHLAIYARSPIKARSARVLVRRMPDDAGSTARQLFATLRALDAEGVKLIWIETPPDTPEWEGVRDRLRRAAS